MRRSDEDALAALEADMRRDDPGLARALETGRLRPARKRGLGPAWTLLAVALTALAAGIVLGQGLVIAVGLVMSGMAGHFFDP